MHWVKSKNGSHSHCHFCLADLLLPCWKRTQSKKNNTSISWQKTSHGWQALNLAGAFSLPTACIVRWTPDLSIWPFSDTGLREGNQSPVWQWDERDQGSKEMGPYPGDRWEKVDLGCPEDNLCLLKGREWCGSVVTEERVGECTLWRKTILPGGSLPLLPLLNSFNKHLTFTGRKINTQEGTLLCSQR